MCIFLLLLSKSVLVTRSGFSPPDVIGGLVFDLLPGPEFCRPSGIHFQVLF